MPSPSDSKTRPSLLPAIPAEAALSFLKDTKGAPAWTARDLATKVGLPTKAVPRAVISNG